MVRRTYNRVEIQTQAGAGGHWLVFNDGWHPGWEARVDGVSQPVRRADIAFKAVWLEPGSHDVVFEFHNSGVLWAYAVLMSACGVGLICGLVYLLAGRRAG